MVLVGEYYTKINELNSSRICCYWETNYCSFQFLSVIIVIASQQPKVMCSKKTNIILIV